MVVIFHIKPKEVIKSQRIKICFSPTLICL